LRFGLETGGQFSLLRIVALHHAGLISPFFSLTTNAIASMDESQLDGLQWIVLVNHEEQYSLWRKDRPVPSGWQQVHGPTTEEACVEYVEQHWVDMRPKSIR
jgi:MbtH protein